MGLRGVEIQAAIASREALETFDGLDGFSVPGVYVLLGPPTDDTSRRAVRPGEAASRTLDARLREHLGIQPDDTDQRATTLFRLRPEGARAWQVGASVDLDVDVEGEYVEVSDYPVLFRVHGEDFPAMIDDIEVTG